MKKGRLTRFFSLFLVLVMVLPLAALAQEEVWKPYDEQGNPIRTDRDATGTEGMVASSNYYASKVGLDILKQGGNAIDAAIATAYAIGVVEPFTSGLGGGGFMLIHSAETGEDVCLDFRERAPGLASPALWTVDEDGKVVGNQDVIGGKAVGVPGEVAGWEYALEHYGSMPREEIMQPAIDLATNGFVVSLNMNIAAMEAYVHMLNYPELGQYFLTDLGLPHDFGDTFKNPDLAKTLKLIAKHGRDGFYKGEVAQKFVDTVQKYGGIITMKDMEDYEVKARKPVSTTYRGYQVIAAPPVSSGGTHLIQILNVLENFDLASMEVNSAEFLHLFSEAFKMAFADRSAYMADTDYQEVPLEGLISKEYAKMLAEKIDPKKSQKYSKEDPYKYQSGSTTHFSIADKTGNMVAVTKTINSFWGSKLAVPGYGFIINNDMDAFVTGEKSIKRIEPGKRPLSSMTPTVVLTAEGKPFMTLGSPGSTRIFPTLAQVISHIIDHGMTMQQAIDTPRIYDNASNKINYESGENGLKPEVVAELEALGHEMVDRGEWNLYFGGVQGILYRDDGSLEGGADPRRDGKALGF